MMEILIAPAVTFLLVLLIVLGYWLPAEKKHREASGGVVNYDFMMRKYVYKVHMSEEEILNALMKKNALDELSCEVDSEQSIIKFSDYYSTRSYYYKIQVCTGYSVLRLEQVSLIGGNSRVPCLLNSFLVSKLGAEPVPFEKYGV